MSPFDIRWKRIYVRVYFVLEVFISYLLFLVIYSILQWELQSLSLFSPEIFTHAMLLETPFLRFYAWSFTRFVNS